MINTRLLFTSRILFIAYLLYILIIAVFLLAWCFMQLQSIISIHTILHHVVPTILLTLLLYSPETTNTLQNVYYYLLFLPWIRFDTVLEFRVSQIKVKQSKAKQSKTKRREAQAKCRRQIFILPSVKAKQRNCCCCCLCVDGIFISTFWITKKADRKEPGDPLDLS